MVRILILLVLLCSITVSGTNYYVSNAGSDSNNGTSPSTSWATLSKVNGASLVAGDNVYFKRGDTWFGTLVPKSGSANTDTTGVYCIGDSQTLGDYPALLSQYLGVYKGEYLVHDVGVISNTTTSMRSRLATDVTSKADADWVIVMGGTFDVLADQTASSIELNLQAMYDSANANGMRVIAMTITPGNYSVARQSVVDAVNAWILAKPLHVDYAVDLYTALEDPADADALNPLYDAGDGLLYTALGNKRVLHTLVQEVRFMPAASKNKRITYGAYGYGNKPVIHQSLVLNSTSDWTNSSGNIWTPTNAGAITVDVGIMLFNNDSIVGLKKTSNISELTAQGHHYSDPTTKVLSLYSVGNPATYYNHIRLCLSSILINNASKSYIRVQDIAIKYSGWAGVTTGGDSFYQSYLNMDLSWIGGGWFTAWRVGNGIDFYNNTHDNVVENCRIWEIYDDGVSNQAATATVEQQNITYRNNVIWNTETSYNFFLNSTDENSSAIDITFENNTCLNSAAGFGHAGRPDPAVGYNLRFADIPDGSGTGVIDNFIVRNNILDTGTNGLVRNWEPSGVYLQDYNVFHDVGSKIGYILTTHYTSFTTYQTNTGWDANGIQDSAEYVNAAVNNYNPQLDSPAMNYGSPSGLFPFAGAYQITDLDAYNEVLSLVHEEDYTAGSWTTYQSVVSANGATSTSTQLQTDQATANIYAAQANLVFDYTGGSGKFLRHNGKFLRYNGKFVKY